MTSLLCVKSSKGSVKVWNQDGADKMFQLDTDDKEAIRLKQTFMPRPPPKANRKESGRQSSQITSNLPVAKFSEGGAVPSKASNFKLPPNHLQDESYHKEIETMRSMCDSLLETEQSFVKDVDKSLKQADLLALRKKELLHKAWSTRVFEPIRSQVLEAVHSPQFTDRERRHREIYRQYLEHTNKRGHIFLDTMDEGEYYAQALTGHRPNPITAYTASLQDPLLKQGRERKQEDQTILRCVTGEVYSLSDIDQIKLPPMPLVPLGRHNTTCHSWINMPLGNIVSTPRKASR